MAGAKRLFLLRHAKSSWDDPTLGDYDRPLAARGRKAAKLIGAYLRREEVQICLVLCSSARRAGGGAERGGGGPAAAGGGGGVGVGGGAGGGGGRRPGPAPRLPPPEIS